MRSRKKQITEDIELPNQEKIRTLGEKEIYKYLGKLEADTIKQVEMKKKKEYISRTRKPLETKPWGRNLIKRNKHLGCFPPKLLGIIFETDEGKNFILRKRKLITVHKSLHLRDHINRLYKSREKEEEDSPALKILWMHQY